jgi:hypothetical protein
LTSDVVSSTLIVIADLTGESTCISSVNAGDGSRVIGLVGNGVGGRTKCALSDAGGI